MANLLLGGVYNHFLTSYASKDVTQSDTHKKDELRDIYKSIVKMNQDAPLYLLPKDGSAEESAISLKEEARQLSGTLSKLQGSGTDALSGQQTAYSSDEDVLSASYIGSDDDTPAPVSMHVDSLASGQVNTGTYLPDERTQLEAGNYYFDARINDQSYEFQFAISAGETNRDVQERISRLINKAGVHLDAQVIQNDDGQSALQITSQLTGLPSGKDQQFIMYDSLSGDHHGVVPYFGMNQTTEEASNAQFEVGGVTRSSTSNHFTLNGAYDITLHQTSETADDSVTVGIKDDNAAMIDNIHKLVDSYNRFISGVSAISSPAFRSGHILSQMSSITDHYRNDLEPLGFSIQDNGQISLDEQLLTQSAEDPASGLSEEFEPVKEFAADVSSKSKEFMLDPMKFADHPIVNYKNPGRTLPNPYITSEYSGMMFNNYC
ncbi:MAG: flagellar filament capping protein FliD [Butyrivibrio sp.]|nr:flagellar filament capping protein FliD [Butyrivibrio sp.]